MHHDMRQDLWRTVNELFHAALDRPVGERGEFVRAAANGDAELEAEVQRLLKADEQAGSYLETPAMADSLLFLPNPSFQLPVGSILKSRFQIVRSLGQGGMGAVFEALDLELKVHIALKAIRPEIAANPATLSYFRSEVRIARTITHPNVCRTFDLDRGQISGPGTSGGEFVFLTMELLPGETLASRLQREGPLSAAAAIAIARQIASALDAAHAAGIVHRDIKPANIMLVPGPSGLDTDLRAVITDFGVALANAASLSTAISSVQLASTVGTLAYMAPEQLEPGREVSAAADIYAFGLVLFEMVSGRRAFPSSNLLSGIAQRLNGSPLSLRAIVPQLPAVWETVIGRCLCVDPASRYASADEVVDVLEGKSPGAAADHSRSVIRSVFNQAARFRGNRTLFAAGAVLAVLALFLIGLRLFRSKASSKVETGALIYLPPVGNRTGDKAMASVGELVRAGLNQSTQVRLVDQSRVEEIVQQMTKSPDTVIDQPTGREIAMRAGAVRVVFCTITGSSGNYTLDVDVQQPDNTPSRYREHWTQSFAWRAPNGQAPSATIPAELASAARMASNWIRLEAGESKNDIARLDIPPEDVTTRSWAALDDFTQALHLYDKADTEGAIASLEHAVALDPNFALAMARLGDFQISLGRHYDGYQSYRKALALTEFQRLTRRERDRISGLAALDSSDFDAAEAAFRDYATLYPDDYRGWFYRGYPLMMLGRPEESLSSLRRAHQLDPTGASAAGQLGIFAAALGGAAEAVQVADDLDRNHHPVQAAYVRGISAFVGRRYQQANTEFAHLADSPEPFNKPWSLGWQARVAAETGQYNNAVDLLTKGIALDAAQGNREAEAAKLLDRAYLKCNRKQFAECLADVRAGDALDDSPQSCDRAGAVLAAATESAAANFAPQFRGELRQLESRSKAKDFGQISRIVAARIQGDEMIADRRWNEAIEAFRRASALDAPASPRAYLANALAEAAHHASNQAEAQAMNREALALDAELVNHIDYVWRRPGDFPPGFLADETAAYLRLARALGPDTDTRRRAFDLYRALRPLDKEFSTGAAPAL
jgi:eukaryotic-like serine/threonine-protein kinase